MHDQLALSVSSGTFPTLPPPYPAFGLPNLGVPPSDFPSLHDSFSPFGQRFVASTFPVPSNPQSNSMREGSSSTSSRTDTTKSIKESMHPVVSASMKSTPPQRAGGSMFLETPPPTKQLTASSSNSKKEHAKRKRRRSYDRSDSD
ncbi:hypothetical protein OESDEN_02261 [Oesophagostomum dentatum]|uniref:Uncharacterized protein n=1 Tax=Oesophagostomum dentatum TaxID=61180 RepID=A0A0B1TQT6_OESDE|nr:hypothetical protein OESDEN_02261 [Oesophagostomum dentatum]